MHEFLKYKITLVLLFIIFSLTPGFSQDLLTQTIRGVVLDKSSGSPLPGANIVVMDTDPLLGASTDQNGHFILESVPTGRQSLQVSFLGYQSLLISNIIVSSAKELVLEIELEEKILQVDEVEIVARFQKDHPINPMALISSRSFSVEETNKYAGSYGDPARMVANYAGVASSRDNRNDIVVRGNSPMGLQYRINGIEIPNPNHFSALGTTGGPVTVLNTNLLTNSDFLTGAFPAEYGNAISGIFDLRMKTGNISRREYWAQLGWNGLEFGLEGPFSKKHNASYIAAYRYSFTDILKQLGVNLPEVARYQDLSFHINIPSRNKGTLRFTSVGGTSLITMNDSDRDSDDWTFPTHGEDINTGSYMAALGLSHHYLFNSTTSIHTILSFVTSEVHNKIDTFSISAPTQFNWAGEKSRENKYSVSTSLSKKINLKNNFDFGFTIDLNDVNYADSQFYKDHYKVSTDEDRIFGLFRAYIQWKHKFTDRFATYMGLHYLFFQLNNSFSIEPRAGLKYHLTPVSSLSFGIGLHSQTQARMMYFVQTQLPDDSYALTNEDMDLTKSFQIILGYDHLLSEHIRFKSEVYYQNLYQVPVSKEIPQFSILNEGTDFFIERQDSLINEGTGNNYGIELTLERFIHKNFFFLFTASLYESQYRGYDKIKRSSSYNGNYAFNAVGGYELPLGKKKNRTLVFGLRLTWSGGRPYVPYDNEQTVKEGQVVYDWDNAYNKRYNDYLRGSFRIGLRRNEKKFNTELAFDLQYRANYTYVYINRIDVVTGEIVNTHKMGFYPTSIIRIQF